MEGPLLQLFNLYFTKEGISDLLFKNTQSYGTLKYGTLMHILIFPSILAFQGIKELTEKYWWAILLGTLGLVGFIVLLVIFGARYTTSDNPELDQRSPARPLPCLCCGMRSNSASRANAHELRQFQEQSDQRM